jgi:predicted transcriptional regulator
LLSTYFDNAVSHVQKLLAGYTIDNVYKALVYSLIYKVIKGRDPTLSALKPLEEKIPKPLLFKARKDLSPVFETIVLELQKTLDSKKPILVENANIPTIAREVRKLFRKIDYVMVYDCMSLNEFILVSAASRSQGFRTILPNLIFVNPIGLTRYVTQQLPGLDYRSVLREYARMLAERLRAKGYYKSAYIDFKVHEYGSMGIEEFLEKINITRIINEITNLASNGIVLITADHGYDIIYDPDSKYIYVLHGYKERVKGNHAPLLLFSRFSPFLTVLPGR